MKWFFHHLSLCTVSIKHFYYSMRTKNFKRANEAFLPHYPDGFLGVFFTRLTNQRSPQQLKHGLAIDESVAHRIVNLQTFELTLARQKPVSHRKTIVNLLLQSPAQIKRQSRCEHFH